MKCNFVMQIHKKVVYIAIIIMLASLFLIKLISCFCFSKETLTTTAINLPIIMYHQILKDKKMWGKYVISPEDFEKDLEYILDKGYTTIVMQDLINYVYNGSPLPDKPIMLTFDDGFLTQKDYLLPILKKHSAKAIVSVVGEYTDRYTKINDKSLSYSYLTWQDIKELVQSEYIEIQNHSYDMHNFKKRKGVGKLRSESKEQYKELIKQDINKLQVLLFEKMGYKPTTFTYPFGVYNKISELTVKELGFIASLTCDEGINYIRGKKSDLYLLKRYNRPYNINRDKFFGRFD